MFNNILNLKIKKNDQISFLFTNRNLKLAGLALFDGLNNRRILDANNSIMLKVL